MVRPSAFAVPKFSTFQSSALHENYPADRALYTYPTRRQSDGANVRFWHKADIPTALLDVCFRG
jgi:hypothetical protein